MSQYKKLQGLISAPFSAMNEDGSLNVAKVPEYYQFLKRNGVTGAFINGSTGEGVSLTLEEKKANAEAWAACTKNDPDFALIVFLGGTCLADCIDLAKHAASIGADAVSFTGPFYFKPGNATVVASMCKEIAAAVPNMAFYYYHIPVLTGVNISMYDLLQAVEAVGIPNFVGIKYTHEDFMDFLSCLTYQNEKYDMLWGRDENLLSALILGTKGGVGSTYNYAAPLYLDLIKAYEAGDFAKARTLQQRSIDMIRLLGKYGGIATGKAYMKLVGQNCGEFRLPIKNMSAEQFEAFKRDTEAAAVRFSEIQSR